MQKKIRQNFLFSSLLKFKRLLNSVIVLRNSATFPFSVSFWSNIFVEYVHIQFSNKQNHIPHKFICCFRITFTNFPRICFPLPSKWKTITTKRKQNLNKILPLKSEQFHVLKYIFDIDKYQIRPRAHWNEVKIMIQGDYSNFRVDLNYW